MFKFLKKGTGQAPPDVGQEEAFDADNSEAGEGDEKIKAPEKISETRDSESVSGDDGKSSSVNTVGPVNNLELERIKSRIESVVTWINQFYERFSYVSENIGELRAMNLENEKKIINATKEAEKVIDIVKEVKPEELRLDYQKVDMRIKTFEEKVAANKQFTEEIMKEVEDIRRKSEIFVGTDALMKLNEDTKKDLVEMQKINSKTKMQGDKAQAIFMELKSGFAESQKSAASMENIESSYSAVKDDLEKIKLNHSTIVRQSDFEDFKKTFGNKISVLNSLVVNFDKLKKENEELGKALEVSLAVSRRNEEDIGNIALKVGDENAKRVTDYENQISDLVSVIEELTSQVSEIKKKVGMKSVKKIEPVVKKLKTTPVAKPNSKIVAPVNVKVAPIEDNLPNVSKDKKVIPKKKTSVKK